MTLNVIFTFLNDVFKFIFVYFTCVCSKKYFAKVEYTANSKNSTDEHCEKVKECVPSTINSSRINIKDTIFLIASRCSNLLLALKIMLW